VSDALPLPDSPELNELVTRKDLRDCYRFLYEHRADPPTMAEWRARTAELYGDAPVQADRRLRELRTWFDIPCRNTGHRRYVYVLEGLKSAPRNPLAISPRLEAQVYAAKGRYCRMCGDGPGDGVRLEIDHIVPRDWGGPTELENLEPLCRRHNHGKQAFVASLDEFSGPIRRAIGLPTPWERIGELLKALAEVGKTMPSDLLPVVGGETHQGDPARRLRELRHVLGWECKVHRRRQGQRTLVDYELVAFKPWPLEGPAEAVRNYERARQQQRG
jgi:hypothetical protein